MFCCSVMSNSFGTPWTVARQALPMGFPRQEYRSGLSFPSRGDLPDPGIKLTALMSPALVGSVPLAPPGKPPRVTFGPPQIFSRNLYLWRRKWQPTPVFLPGESHGQ